MTESQTLLAQYAKQGSEEAFRELVRRYIDLVYSTALRKVDDDAQLAENVAQTVFIDLARKANAISAQVMLGGWLHERTCHVVATVARGERRRRLRERKAAEMNATQDHGEPNLAQLRPVLDEAIRRLGTEDRATILLRFFEQRELRAVGQALGCTPEAARMPITRALNKLQILLKHRGLTLSASILGTILTTRAVTAAPVGLATSIAAKALTGSALGGAFSGALIKLATMTKLQATVLSAAVLIAATTSMLVERQPQAALHEQDERLRQQSEALARQQTENEHWAGLLSQNPGPNSLADLASLRQNAPRTSLLSCEKSNRDAPTMASGRELIASPTGIPK